MLILVVTLLAQTPVGNLNSSALGKGLGEGIGLDQQLNLMSAMTLAIDRPTWMHLYVQNVSDMSRLSWVPSHPNMESGDRHEEMQNGKRDDRIRTQY
jgi:hypothetical protein